MTPRLSAVVAARDEAEMLPGCLARLGFVDEVVVLVDDRTTDDTAGIAHRAGAVVDVARFTDFASFKNSALDRATGDWALVVDADERVDGPLAREIRGALTGDHDAYRIPIENWFYGSRVRHAGYRERPIRLFRRAAARYVGDIHEELRFDGEPRIGRLGHGLAHFSHRSIGQNLAKTAAYADVQAAEMLRTGHRRVTSWTLLKVVAGQLWRRLLAGQGFRDGTPGVIESLYQPLSMFAVYTRLWELQQRPSVEERYRRAEEALPR